MNRIYFLIIFLYGFNLLAMDRPVETTENFVGKLQWATATSAHTLELMKHSGLYRLVPRGLLMKNYGLPILSGSSILTGAFDERNGKALSGNIVTSIGGVCDLTRLVGLCSMPFKRAEISEQLRGHLKEFENRKELFEHDLRIVKEILLHLKKIDKADIRADFPQIFSRLPKDSLKVPVACSYKFDPDVFFADEDARENFPIIFATTKLLPAMSPAKGSGCPYEHLVEAELELGRGKDIDYVFVGEKNLATTKKIIADMFADEIMRPFIISFEEVQKVLLEINMPLIMRVSTLYPRIPLAEAKALKEQTNSTSFLPAFLHDTDPVALTCKGMQIEEILQNLKQANLRPINIRSPNLPSFPSFLAKVSVPQDETFIEAQAWIFAIRQEVQGLKTFEGADVNIADLIIEIEIGL